MEPKVPFSHLASSEQTIRLTQMVQQAYFRRSRQLPANLSDMVACLKGDILKHIPDIPVDTLDMAITTGTLDNEAPLSVAFFFSEAKKRWYQPKVNVHQWDEDQDRRPDFEKDTIDLLDILTSTLEAGRKLYFNPRREYAYLVMRGQLSKEADKHFKNQALAIVNEERFMQHQAKIVPVIGKEYPDITATARGLAVTDWLQSCITRGTKPSKILVPLINEKQYREFRLKSA